MNNSQEDPRLQTVFNYDISHLRANLHTLNNNSMTGSALACSIVRELMIYVNDKEVTGILMEVMDKFRIRSDF